MHKRITSTSEFIKMAEINPPELPNMQHQLLRGRWPRVMVTDNPFRMIRVSPYAYAARITHDVPTVHPTVVVSTRDRNVLAIESEIRGALGNGVSSFLIVKGDSVPGVEHASEQFDIVAHLRMLQEKIDIPFEVGMTVGFSEKAINRRIDAGAQFFVSRATMSAEGAVKFMDIGLHSCGIPAIISFIPPFSKKWVQRMERLGVHSGVDRTFSQRWEVWEYTYDFADDLKDAGFAGVVIMGLSLSTAVGEAYHFCG